MILFVTAVTVFLAIQIAWHYPDFVQKPVELLPWSANLQYEATGKFHLEILKNRNEPWDLNILGFAAMGNIRIRFDEHWTYQRAIEEGEEWRHA